MNCNPQIAANLRSGLATFCKIWDDGGEDYAVSSWVVGFAGGEYVTSAKNFFKHAVPLPPTKRIQFKTILQVTKEAMERGCANSGYDLRHEDWDFYSITEGMVTFLLENQGEIFTSEEENDCYRVGDWYFPSWCFNIVG